MLSYSGTKLCFLGVIVWTVDCAKIIEAIKFKLYHSMDRGFIVFQPEMKPPATSGRPEMFSNFSKTAVEAVNFTFTLRIRPLGFKILVGKDTLGYLGYGVHMGITSSSDGQA